jgi:RNA polymerase sigma factor (sigma-70 family)
MENKKTQKEKDEENGKIHAVKIVEIQNGSKKEEGELFKLTKTKLYNVAYKLCKGSQKAKALCAEAWDTGLKLIKEKKYKEQNGFEKWMSAIIRNTFNRHKRDDPKYKEVKDYVDFEDITTEAAKLKEVLMVFMELALPKLTKRKQLLIRNFFWDDMSYLEIATELKVSEAYVRKEIWNICRFIEAAYEKENK